MKYLRQYDSQTPNDFTKLYDYAACFCSYVKHKENSTNIQIDKNDLYKLSKNIETLKSFLELEENWNYYGAKPFKQELINKCINLVRSSKLKYQPDIFPTGRESIQFEYEEEDGRYLEIEIYDDRISYLYIDSFGCETEKEDEQWENMIKLTEKFHDYFRIY
ncbi:hypothetical protein JW964_23640 [candidate division KSB1 bacterium]|nr:hypothetical protein [candidate division KSB1 bacterium]